MRFFTITSRIFSRKKLPRFAPCIVLFLLQATLFAATLPTPPLPNLEENHEWDFWDYVIFSTIFGVIVLLILSFAKKHDEIDL